MGLLVKRGPVSCLSGEIFEKLKRRCKGHELMFTTSTGAMNVFWVLRKSWNAWYWLLAWGCSVHKNYIKPHYIQVNTRYFRLKFESLGSNNDVHVKNQTFHDSMLTDLSFCLAVLRSFSQHCLSAAFTILVNFTCHLDKERRIRKFSPGFDANMVALWTYTWKLTLQVS